MENVEPLVWWNLSNVSHANIIQCETKTKLHAEQVNLNQTATNFEMIFISNHPYCDSCDTFDDENAEHMILTTYCDIFLTLMGKPPVGVEIGEEHYY